MRPNGCVSPGRGFISMRSHGVPIDQDVRSKLIRQDYRRHRRGELSDPNEAINQTR